MTAPRGRPPRTGAAAPTRITVRLSVGELAELDRAAEAAGLPRAEYIRAAALSAARAGEAPAEMVRLDDVRAAIETLRRTPRT